MKQVKSLVTLEGLLTKDNIYTVLSEVLDPAKRIHYTVVDDRGVQCLYSESRFELVLAPQVAPNFSQMQQIADEVKITSFGPSEPKPQIDISDRLVCPVVEEADRRKAMINLKNAMLDGQLKEQLTARREIALQDCDANLAALLYRAKDRITELEDQLAVPKRGAQ